MTTSKPFLLLSILILTGGMSFTNLYTIDSVLAIESECDLKILSQQLSCTSGSVSGRSSVIASTGTAHEQMENSDVSINNAFASASNTSQIIAGEDNDENNNDKDNSMDSNIESQIPSTINAIPFP
jgi:hypothetical protein